MAGSSIGPETRGRRPRSAVHHSHCRWNRRTQSLFKQAGKTGIAGPLNGIQWDRAVGNGRRLYPVQRGPGADDAGVGMWKKASPAVQFRGSPRNDAIPRRGASTAGVLRRT